MYEWPGRVPSTIDLLIKRPLASEANQKRFILEPESWTHFLQLEVWIRAGRLRLRRGVERPLSLTMNFNFDFYFNLSHGIPDIVADDYLILWARYLDYRMKTSRDETHEPCRLMHELEVLHVLDRGWSGTGQNTYCPSKYRLP